MGKPVLYTGAAAVRARLSSLRLCAAAREFVSLVRLTAAEAITPGEHMPEASLRQINHRLDRLLFVRHFKRKRKGGVDLRRYLRHKGRRRRASGAPKKEIIPNRVSIHERPMEANNRAELGHWEADLMIGSSRRVTIVLNCRKTRRGISAFAPDKTAHTICSAIIERLRDEPAKTITFDNGTEFAKHHLIKEALGCQTLFCDHNTPSQRGTNENFIGLLRDFIPKGSDLKAYSNDTLQSFINNLNSRPMKKLNWESRDGVYSRLKRAL